MNELEINDFWNRLVRPDSHATVGEDTLDPALAETIRLAQSLSTTPPPVSSRSRVREQVRANVRQQIATSEQVSGNVATVRPMHGPNGRTEAQLGSSPRPRFPAERRRWLVAQLATAALLIVTLLGMYFIYQSRNQQAVPPPATPSSDVFFDRGNLARTGEMPGSGPTTKPSLLWSFADEDQGVFSSAVVVDGVVYVGNGGQLLALDSSTGTKQWEFPIQGPLVLLAPAVGNGLVYAGSTNGQLFAIDASSGTQRWVYSTAGLVFSGGDWVDSPGGSILSSPLIIDDVVYVTTGRSATANTDAYLIALNAETGEKLWGFDIGGGVASSPAYDDGVIFMPGTYWVNGRSALFAVDAVTGMQRWIFQPEDDIHTTPSIANGMVFVASDHAIYALDAASGTERWHFGAGSDSSRTRSAIAVANGIVYAANDVAGTLYALDAQSGTKLWEVNTVQGAQRAPVVAGSVVLLGTQQGSLLALDALDGHELWRQDTGSHILSSPTVSNGVVFFGDEGTIYALGDATEPSNSEG